MKNAVDSLNGGLAARHRDAGCRRFQGVRLSQRRHFLENLWIPGLVVPRLSTPPLLALGRFFRLCYSGGCSSERR